MKKIPFNMNLRPEIESGRYEVLTTDERPARIICWDMNFHGDTVLVALIKNPEKNNEETCTAFTFDGKMKIHPIIGNAVELILVDTKEPKLTVFEEAVKGLCWRIGMGEMINEDDQIRSVAGELLALAKEEKPVEECRPKKELTEFERAVKRGFLCAGYKVPDEIVKDTASELLTKARNIERSQLDAIIPTWEYCECHGVGSQRYTIVSGPCMDAKNEYILDTIGQKRIYLSQLEKLPITGTGVSMFVSGHCGLVNGK